MRQTIMEVDLNKFNKNIDAIQSYVGDKILMPVIKANGYGTYVNKDLNTINRFDIVAVAMVQEAVELRKIGYEKEIFVLNQPFVEEMDEICENNISIGISSIEFIEEAIKENRNMRVHLEIETGMNRTGIKLEVLEKILYKINESSLIVEGVYTHFSSADYDENYTNMQIEKFKKAVEIVKAEFPNIKYIHSSASNGLLKYDDGVSNTVRPGIIMYGYEPYNGALNQINVEPICKLKSKISYIKNVNVRDAISYSQSFIADKPMRVATIAIGYADGLKRALSNKGYVVVNGQKAKIIGNICMDGCMIDVTDIENVSVGNDVYIWDNENQTIEQMAEICGTINYEIMSSISSRVPRVFV